MKKTEQVQPTITMQLGDNVYGKLVLELCGIVFRDGDEEFGSLRWNEGIVRFEGHLGRAARSALCLDFPLILSTSDKGAVFEVRITDEGVECSGSCDPAAATFFEAVAHLRKKSNVD